MRRLRHLLKSSTFIGLIVLTGCSSLLYYPDHNLYVEEELMEYRPEDVTLPLQGGGEIHGWYFTASHPKGVIIYFHGNGQNRSSHFVNLYWLVREGYNLFAAEYPGYGDTDGKPTPQNTIAAGHASLRYIKERNPQLPMIVYGQSLGGAVALRTAIDMKNEIPMALVVADSSFLSYQRVAAKILKKSWLTFLFQWLPYLVLDDSFAPGTAVKELSPVPLLVIHGTKDPVIPFAMGEEIYQQAREPKELWSFESEFHGQPFTGRDGAARRIEFLTKLTKYLSHH